MAKHDFMVLRLYRIIKIPGVFRLDHGPRQFGLPLTLTLRCAQLIKQLQLLTGRFANGLYYTVLLSGHWGR